MKTEERVVWFAMGLVSGMLAFSLVRAGLLDWFLP